MAKKLTLKELNTRLDLHWKVLQGIIRLLGEYGLDKQQQEDFATYFIKKTEKRK